MKENNPHLRGVITSFGGNGATVQIDYSKPVIYYRGTCSIVPNEEYSFLVTNQHRFSNTAIIWEQGKSGKELEMHKEFISKMHEKWLTEIETFALKKQIEQMKGEIKMLKGKLGENEE